MNAWRWFWFRRRTKHVWREYAAAMESVFTAAESLVGEEDIARARGNIRAILNNRLSPYDWAAASSAIQDEMARLVELGTS